MEDVDESYFDWSDEEDIICSSKYISSDEDDDLCSALAYKPRQKGGSVFKSKHKQDEEDDFEKEMASELSQTMQYLTSSLGVPGSSGASKSTDNCAKQASEFYDDIYFDSDESDPEESTPGQPPKVKKQKQPRRHKVLSNDELFYDPTMDDRDQEWVNQKRRSYQPRGRRLGRTLGVENNNTIQLPPSDAVLNCPACLTTLCMDCQRHEIYHNQYRAMFVFNCVVNVMERLSYPKKDQKKQNFFKNKKARRNKKQEVKLEMKGEQRETEAATVASTVVSGVEAEENPATQSINPTASNSHSDSDPPTPSTDSSALSLGKDLYHPVMCKICNTKVAVYDSDEVYHFFNVVTSY